MAVQMQQRRGTAAAWTAADPTLAEGEIGVELDTGSWKLGDGVTAWTALAYSTGTQGASGTDGAVGLPGPFGYSGEDGDDGLVLPGPSGATGAQGAQGVQGEAGAAGVTDHGALTGLADDDHTQYATNTEFDDHSARHEDAGADEISLAGLSGTPADLTTHAAAADPHTGYVLESVSRSFTVGAFIDGSGSAVTTGIRPVWYAPFDCTVTGVRAWADTGTTTVVNAGTGVGSAEDFCSTNLTLSPADAWEVGTVNQNQAVAAGETVSVEIVTAGTATQVTIQVEFTRP